MDVESKYYMFLVRRQPVVIERGEGTRVWDVDGKEYLDFTSGWAVNNVGHANPVVADAIAEQARTLLQTSNQFYTVPQLKLAEILVENSAMDKVFFCNSGTEANEGAIKLARRYGATRRNGAFEILTALNSFHGRTMMNVAATGQPHYQELFQPIPPGFSHVPFDDIEALKGAVTDRTVAIMLEPVQAEGGVNIPSQGYLQNVRDFCDENELLLIFDEVQTGLGRLGTLFGYESFGVEPDIMALAKGLGGGFPVGAYGASAEIMSEVAPLGPMYQAGTLSGNPVAMAAGIATIDELSKPGVYEGLRATTDKLADGLIGVFDASGVQAAVNRVCGLLTVFFTGNPVFDMRTASATDREAFGAFFHGMVDNGVYLPPSQFEAWFVSTAHTDADIEQTLDAVKKSLPA